MKRLFALLTGLIFIITMYTSARSNIVTPNIIFNGAEAVCTAEITCDRLTDKISYTMSLWQGNTLIDSWSGNGSGFLTISETASVSKGNIYKLSVECTVNGTALMPVSITRANK